MDEGDILLFLVLCALYIILMLAMQPNGAVEIPYELVNISKEINLEAWKNATNGSPLI